MKINNNTTQKIIKEINQYQADSTNVLLKKYIATWQQYIQVWLKQAISLRNIARQVEKEVDKASEQQTLESFMSSSALQNLKSFAKTNNYRLTTKTKLTQQNLAQSVTGAYKIVNNIAETIRGEQIIYNVAFSSSSETGFNANEIYTAQLTLEEVMNLGLTNTLSTGRLVMRSPATILKILREIKYNNKMSWLQYLEREGRAQKWSEPEVADFQALSAQIHGASWGHWANINTGNIFEIYNKFTQDWGYAISKPEPDRNYWEAMVACIKSVMSQPISFMQGPDRRNKYGAYQDKFFKASITNFSTLINMMYDLYNVFNKILSSSNLNSITMANVTKYSQQIANSLDRTLDASIDKNINDLIRLVTDLRPG